MAVVAESMYILFASARGTVGVVYRSHVDRCRGVFGIPSYVFPEDFWYDGWNRSVFIGT